MTRSGNNNKLIKDWIRPLQKSLTIETENKFINTLGREKHFNDYLHESLKKIENLNRSIQKNKINDLKNQFQRLIKKETFWRQKEITFNKIN